MREILVTVEVQNPALDVIYLDAEILTAQGVVKSEQVVITDMAAAVTFTLEAALRGSDADHEKTLSAILDFYAKNIDPEAFLRILVQTLFVEDLNLGKT